MWLWSITWCAKWKALSQAKSDQSQHGEDWSADNSAAELVRHVRDRVECYLSPAIVRRVRQEPQELPAGLRAHGVRNAHP
jgi:hypothetical protein